MMSESEKNFSFEEAYSQLEETLKKLSADTTPLELSLNLYEEASRLIALCNKKLTQAEQKIERVVKSREEGATTAPFTPPPKESACHVNHSPT